MLGKEKCKILKNIRAQIALQNDIEWVTRDCSYQGSCSGTCPKCEAEVRQLEKELELKRKLGKVVQIAGLSLALSACTSTVESDVEPLAGDFPYEQEEKNTEPEEQETNPEDEIEVLAGEVPLEVDE